MKKDRSFIILPGNLKDLCFLDIIRKYIQLRPINTRHGRFFINYCQQKCTTQPVGIHKIASVPSIVARYLELENPSLYTGHCFRRTSASFLANSGATMENIMRHGGWQSSNVAEGYIEESENTKKTIANKIMGNDSSELTSTITSNEIFVSNPSTSGINVSNNTNCVINLNFYK